MAFTNPHPAPMVAGERLTTTILNALLELTNSAIDGAGGGTYNLTNPLVIRDDLVEVDDLQVNDDLTVDDDVQIGGDAHVDGTIEADFDVIAVQTVRGDNVEATTNVYCVGVVATTGTFSGACTVGGALTVTGAATFNGSATFNDPATFHDSATFNDPTAFNDPATFAAQTRFPVVHGSDADPGLLPGRVYIATPSTFRVWTLPTSGVSPGDWIWVCVDAENSNQISLSGFGLAGGTGYLIRSNGEAGHQMAVLAVRAGGRWNAILNQPI